MKNHVYGVTLPIGTRVELSPSCDLWMRGARFGTIHSVSKDGKTAKVKMDNTQVKRLVKVTWDLVREV